MESTNGRESSHETFLEETDSAMEERRCSRQDLGGNEEEDQKEALRQQTRIKMALGSD
jgi:hypothetical protein